VDINMLLSTVVLVSFIVTIILAVGSYLAFKGRERRRPDPQLASRNGEPVFFERIYMQPKKVEASSSGVRELRPRRSGPALVQPS
jgi:predicted membrane protein